MPPATIAAGAGTLNIPTATNAQPTTATYNGLVDTLSVCLSPYPIDSVFSHSKYTALKTNPTAAAFTPPNMICVCVCVCAQTVVGATKVMMSSCMQCSMSTQ
jgi:hypothetical protein